MPSNTTKVFLFSKAIPIHLLVCCVLILNSCNKTSSTSLGNKEGIKITGRATHLTTGFVYLEQLEIKNPNNNKVLDTVEIGDNGNFSFYLSVDEPSFYIINFNNKQRGTLLLTGNEKEVNITAHGNDPKGTFNVTGSKDTQYKIQIDDVMIDYQQQVGLLQQQQRSAQVSGDLNKYQITSFQIQNAAIEAENKIKDLVKASVPSLAAAYGARMIRIEENVMFIDSILNQLTPIFPNNQLVTELKNQVISRKKLALGMEAPEIILPDTDGKIVKLSAFRGKYVLIDFWAAWCRPCRIENPNIVKVYNDFSDKEFEIIGVSLDRSKEEWIRAIKNDKLPWIHVSDLKFWGSPVARTYQISSIPASILIDPEGKIIAKNLRGKSLEVKLKEIFG